MSEYWLMLFITLVLEIVAIAIVAVFGMTFIAKSYEKIIAYVEKRWGSRYKFWSVMWNYFSLSVYYISSNFPLENKYLSKT